MAQGNFHKLIEGEKPTLVDFSAEWCGPCKMMKPILDEVKTELGDKARIIKIDIDKNPAIAAAYQVRSVPTLIIFKQGKIVWQQSGVVTTSFLTRAISRFS